MAAYLAPRESLYCPQWLLRSPRVCAGPRQPYDPPLSTRQRREPLSLRLRTNAVTLAALLDRAEDALIQMMDTIKTAPARGVPAQKLEAARMLHRKAQWRLDFVAAENSMGFHAPQEAARILAEAIDYARQAQIMVLDTDRQ